MLYPIYKEFCLIFQFLDDVVFSSGGIYLEIPKNSEKNSENINSTGSNEIYSNAIKEEPPSTLETLECLNQDEKAFTVTENSSIDSTQVNLQNQFESNPTTENAFKCSESLPSDSDLQQNMMARTDENILQCTRCCFSCSNLKSLRKHILRNHGEKKYKCSECDMSFAWKSEYKRHLVIHSSFKPFKCNHCSYSSRYKKCLNYHVLKRHTTDKPFKCTRCNFSTAVKGALNKHMIRKHS